MKGGNSLLWGTANVFTPTPESTKLYMYLNPDAYHSSWVNVTLNTTAAILSPNYPYYYPPSIKCVWHLTSNQGLSYVIKFQNFDTEPDADVFNIGSRGYELAESVIIWQFSSSVPSHVVAVVQQMDLWLQFVSDVSSTRGGFQLAIERINDSGTFGTLFTLLSEMFLEG